VLFPPLLQDLRALKDEIERQAAIGGYLNAFVMSALVAAVAFPLAWMFRMPKRGDRMSPPGGDS